LPIFRHRTSCRCLIFRVSDSKNQEKDNRWEE
jgi:hypothetical protein